MAICERCHRWMGHTAIPTHMATPPVPGTWICRRCRAAERRMFWDRVTCIAMLLAAIICLAGLCWPTWKQSDPIHWPDGDEMQHARPVPREPAKVLPEPGSDGAAPEELPEPPIPSAMSNDF